MRKCLTNRVSNDPDSNLQMSEVRPTIALCIPAYRAEEHLPRLLDSAKLQNPPFDEIIVCVDASPDATADVARSFDVTVIENEINLGCSASKNQALRAATADWIHFHDADDILLPEFAREAHDWMSSDQPPDVVIMGYEYLDFRTGSHLATGLQDDTELASDPVGYAIRHKLPNFGIYQREKIVALGGFDQDPATLYNEDVAFHLKLAIGGLSFRASNKVTSINYRHEHSMSAVNATKCHLAHCEVMRRAAEKTGARYSAEIASRIWGAATGLACHQAWQDVDRALSLARQIHSEIPSGQSRAFARLCSVIGPPAAFRLRERMIRIFKPQLREAFH